MSHLVWTEESAAVTLTGYGADRSFRWGRWDAFGTAAHWVWRAVADDYEGRVAAMTASASLRDELVFALLGGFGVTSESAMVAQRALAAAGLLRAGAQANDIEDVLRRPMSATSGGPSRRYRFPRQRSLRVASALDRLDVEEPPIDGCELRAWLETFDGVGPKTSGWVVRNVTGSDDVAIIDIWVARACRLAGVFDPGWRPERDYRLMESTFVQFAAAAGIRTSALDLCIWEYARRSPRLLCAA